MIRANHVDFLLKFTLAFGAVFELPLVITLLARMGVVTPKFLAKNRKYAILDQLRHRRRPDADARHLQPDPDGGPLIILYEVGISRALASSAKRSREARPRRRSAAPRASPATAADGRAVSLMDFTSLDLPEPVMQGIRDAGFVTTTPIQEAALPLALKGKDVAGQSQTGTGKTAAFLIAAFTRLPAHARRRPERGDRAARARSSRPPASWSCRSRPTRSCSAPTPLQDPRRLRRHRLQQAARRARRRAATSWSARPGRLIDYLKQHVWSPAARRGAGHRRGRPHVRHGLHRRPALHPAPAAAPEKRQSFLFSATLSFRVMELTWEFMNNPAQITITPAAEDGREGGAGALPRGARGEVHAAPRAPAARGRQPHPHLRQHPRGGAAARGPAGPQRLAGARAHRRRRAEAAAAGSSTTSRRASCPCWSPPTSPRAACTSRR